MTNAREARFVEEYVVCLNATQAATRAGYSARTAKQQGSRLLTRPHVAAAVQEAQERRAAKVDVKADEVIRELKIMAFARDDVRDADKLKALELLGRHLKMFTDKVEQTGVTLEELVREAQRLREDRDRKAGLNPHTHRPLQPGDQGYAENEEAAKAAAAAEAASNAPAAPERRDGDASERTPALAAEPSVIEIDEQPDPEPGRFNPLLYLRGGDA